MNIFECEVCSSQEAIDHEELVAHILNEHSPEYSESDAEYYSSLWEDSKLEQLDVEDVYEPENPVDRDPL